MDQNQARQLTTRLLAQYEVGSSFVEEILPLIDEIIDGEFSDPEKKTLLRLVEDAFRRQAEIEREKKVRTITIEHLSQLLTEWSQRKNPEPLGPMDDPRNRISGYRKSIHDLRSGDGPYLN